MTENEYQCAMCGGVFTKGWSEQEARAETQSYWPDTPQEDLAVICDDCWQKVHPETHPMIYDAHTKEWLDGLEAIRQTIIRTFEIPPSMISMVVDGTVQPVPLQIEQEASKHE